MGVPHECHCGSMVDAREEFTALSARKPPAGQLDMRFNAVLLHNLPASDCTAVIIIIS